MTDSKIISGLNIGGDEATIYNFRSGYSFYGEADGSVDSNTYLTSTDLPKHTIDGGCMIIG